MALFTSSELRQLLSHPDAFVRSHADWAREYRGEGWRSNLNANLIDVVAADNMEWKLHTRLTQLRLAGLPASDKYKL